MIISAIPNSEHYNPESSYYDVYLDGVKQYHCYFANEDEGYIERYTTDDKGAFIIEPNGEEISTERVYGKVSVKRIGE